MKFKNLFRTVLSVLVIVSMLASIPVFAEEPEGEQQYTITEPYEYPCARGTQLWENTPNRKLRIEACQIPENTLKSLTTKALIETIINYPYIMELQLWNTMTEGYEQVSSQLNAFGELEIRNNSSSELLKLYESFNILTDTQRKTATLNERQAINTLEVLLSQDRYLEKMTDEELSRLEIAVSQKIDQKKDYHNSTYSVFGTSLEQRGISTYYWTENDPHTTTYVSTPRGSLVEVWSYSTELDAEQRDDQYDGLMDYPSAQPIGVPTAKYNCHSYAWYQQSTSNRYWMPYADEYVTDGSYNEYSTPRVGDVVYYYGGAFHSGKVTSVSGSAPKVTSKWGPGCLVSHLESDCPYSSYTTYYRR